MLHSLTGGAQSAQSAVGQEEHPPNANQSKTSKRMSALGNNFLQSVQNQDKEAASTAAAPPTTTAADGATEGDQLMRTTSAKNMQ